MAKQFQFRLATLLKLRSRTVEQYQQELTAILHQKAYVEAQLMHHRQQLESATTQFENASYHSIQELETQWHYIRQLQWHIQQLEQQYATITAREAQCRRRLTEALQQQRSLEKLRDRKYQEYQQRLLRTEQKQLDEIGQQQHFRNKRSQP